jgi:hypothetical protein
MFALRVEGTIMPATTIRIEMSQRADGADIARFGDYQAISRHGAEMALARELVAAGFPDSAWCTECRGQVRLHGSSLYALARLTVSEGDSQRVTFKRWQPMLQKPVAKAA